MPARTFEGRIPLQGGAAIDLHINGMPLGPDYWHVKVSSPYLGEHVAWVDDHPNVTEWRLLCIYEVLATLGLNPKIVSVEGRWTQ